MVEMVPSVEAESSSGMAKEEEEEESEPVAQCSAGSTGEPAADKQPEQKVDQNFVMPPINYKYKFVQWCIRRHKKKKVGSQISSDDNQLKDSKKHKRSRRRSKKRISVEIASDKNIAILLRSEGLFEYINKGIKIPYEYGRYISQKTGFKSVDDLNTYILAHRKKFIVLVDKKEKHCQTETYKCNGSLQRSNSVDLNLYITHHYGDAPKKST